MRRTNSVSGEEKELCFFLSGEIGWKRETFLLSGIDIDIRLENVVKPFVESF